ncbi:DUF2341 domain-containing protein, partial [bacterium]|nr:DUF2341 domain-containing protein [bacterium]
MRSIRIHKALLFTLGSLVGTTAAIAQTIIPAGFGAMSVTQPSRETAVLTGVLNSTGGQNPTVKIRWGDEDRGTAVTPSTTWDNEETVSTNQAAGTFSTTITIPNLEKVYYFRAIASNSGGTVVSSSLGMLLPSAPVGVANLLGRWNFDSENANDSSGTGRHGIAKKLFSPSEVSSMKLWLDASSLSTAGSTWDDKSGNTNDAIKNGSPSIVLGAQNGKNIMRYSGTTGEFHSWTQMTDIRTVFWVLKKTGSNPNMLLLGDASTYFFHPNGSNAMYHPSLGPVANVRGGTTKINGTSANGTSTGIPTSMSVVSLKTSGNVTASNFANDRNIVQSGVNRVFGGDLGELLIFNTALSDADIVKIEGYLAHKWGLSGALASSHPYKLGTPTSASGTPTYIADTPFGSGKAIDLADGHVEVLTGASENTFDGGSAFSVSAWVKGWPNESFAPFVSKGAKFNKPTSVPSLRLWLDGADTSTMDKGASLGASGTPVDGNTVKFWGDKSGNGHHATSTNSPTYQANAVNSNYPGIDTDGDAFTIANSGTAFDAWDSMTLFFVTKWGSSSYWTWGIQKGYNESAGWQVQRMNTGAGQATGMWFARPGTSHTRLTGSWSMDARTDTKIITMRYDGSSTNMKFYANGSYIKQHTSMVSSFVSNTSDQVKVGQAYKWGEILIYRNALVDADRELVEGYLASKFGMSAYLPSDHDGLSTDGWALGRGSSMNGVSSILSGVGGVDSGSTSSISPYTDNSWHHVVTTFDGGNRKLYIDSVEVSSLDSSGSITANAHALIFGGTDLNSSAAGEDATKSPAVANHSNIKLDEVRIYDTALSSSAVTEMFNYGKGDLAKVGGFSTVPSTIIGAAGVALSSTVTADFPNALYSAYNLPDGLTFTGGLSINSATGEISGTPTVGGSHVFTVLATGGTNEKPQKATANITYLAPVSAPKFGTPGAANVLTTSALLLAEIEQSGASSNTVDFVWDTSDKNTSNISDWNGSALAVGAGKEGFYGKQISGLSINTTYFYRNRVNMNLGPLDLASDLKVWLDASDLTSVPNPWVDKSGSGNSPEKKGSGHTIATSAQNGLNVLKFNTATEDYYEKTSSTITDDDQTWLFLVKPLSSQTLNSNASAIFALGRGSYTLRFSSGNTGYYRGRALVTGPSGWHLNSLWLTHTAGGSSTNKGGVWNLIGLHRVGTTIQLYMNGTTVNSGTASSYVLGNDTYFRIMAGSSNYTVRGDLAEVIAFQSKNDTTRVILEGYLAHKWGLTSILPSGHTYKTTALTSTAWSDVQSFTTETSISAPVLGAQSVANKGTTTADLEVVLTDNGNDATTITFFYGDNDGGTTPSSWDSNVTFSNALEATIRKSITGLTSGRTYHFRAFAKNSASTNNGEDWADSSTAFTTVTSSVREETEAVRYSDLKGWWKLDGNLLDNLPSWKRHAISNTTPLNDLSLWLDAADLSTVQLGSGSVQTWNDKSGNAAHVSQATGGNRPSLVYGGQNGLTTIRFDGSNDYLRSTSFSVGQPFSVYAVVKTTGTSGRGYLFDGVTDNNQRSLLALHESGQIKTWAGNWASSNLSTPTGFATVSAVFNSSSSQISLDGKVVSSLNPNTRNLTNGITIGANYQANNDFLKGDIAELFIINHASSDTDRQELEAYLAQKWGLTDKLPSHHNFVNIFEADSPTGTGKSLDLSNGVHAHISTGGSEDLFDGDTNFSTSMWVKGWPSAASESIIAKNDFNPGAFGNLTTWLDASQATNLSTDASIAPPNDDDAISQWYDLSGNKHHARVRTGTPKWDATGFNSKPGVILNGSGLVLDDSKLAFDAWSKLHVFVAFYQPGDSNFGTLFGKSNYAGWMANDKDMGWAAFTHRLDGGFNHWGIGAINSAASANIYLNNFNKALQGADGGAPGMFTVSYAASGGFWGRMNGGSQETSSTGVVGGIQSKTGLDFTIGCHSNGGGTNNMAIGEFIIFNDVISDADRNKIEGYLAHKWNLTSTLPSGHAYKSSAPAFGGWAIERASSGADNIALNMTGAGGEFSKPVPINDNEWHHLATTFGGGNKKIYIDGVEVGTASQSGSVTASSFKLILGDANRYGGSNTRPKINDVRFYRGILNAAEVAAIYNNGSGDVGSPKFAITSPSAIIGAVDKNVSYQITTDRAYGMTGYNSSITYTLLNEPDWLSANSSTGKVSGTPPLAGTYSFQAKASNSLGTAIKDVTITATDYSNWNYALSFTTDYNSNDPLQDWNMLVRLSEDSSNGAGNAGFRYSQASPNGGDLRFITKAGEELKYEIANWNTSGESQVWVRAPSLASDANITMYWGNTNAGLPAYANNGSTWDDYFGVYHLEGTAGTASDSSPLSNDLPGVNAPVLVSSGLSGASYSSTSAANNGFLGSISSNTKGKEGTYTIWANIPSNPPDWKDFFGVEYNNDSAHFLRFQADNASPSHVELKADGGSKGTFLISDPNDDLSGWKMLTLVVKDGYASVYVNGVLDGTAGWYFPGLDTISKVAIGRGTEDGGADITFDEATFSTVGRSATWLLASYNNQKSDQSSNPYLNFESLVGPISLDDEDYTEIYGKKGTAINEFSVARSGSGSFSASGLSGTGLSIDSATGVITGTPLQSGSTNITITATGTTAGGGTVTVTKAYTIQISDPSSFPFSVNLTLAGYIGSSTLTDFPVLVSLSTSITGFSYNGYLDSDGDGVRTGEDLRFYSSNGKELAYEIADWNTSGTSNIWVKAPAVSGNNTVITAAWGKTGTDTTPDYATNDPVWNNDFQGVWHFGATSTTFPDSSPNGNHATKNSVGETNAGQVGKAATFSGSEFADVAYSELVNTDKFTITIWAKRGSGTGHVAPYSARDISNNNKKGYILYSENNTFQFWTGNGANAYILPPASSSHNLNTWYQIAVTYDGTTKKIWLNGAGGAT